MKSLLFLLVCLLFLTAPAAAQGPFISPAFGISIDTPKGWVRFSNSETKANLDAYQLDKTQRKKLLEIHKAGVTILSLVKRRPTTVTEVIPTIKIVGKHTFASSKEELFEALKNGMEDAMTMFTDFSYTTPFTLTEINGLPVIKAAFTYTVPGKGKKLAARTFIYAFFRTDYFVQIAFSDSGSNEDEGELFNRLIQSVAFRK